jgi:hypothetical protein
VVWLRFELGSAGYIVTLNNLPSYCTVLFVTGSIARSIIVICYRISISFQNEIQNLGI